MITEKNISMLLETDYNETAVRKQIADNENKVKEILSNSNAPEAKQALSIIKQNDKLLRRKYYLNGYTEEDRSKKASRGNASNNRFHDENSGAAMEVASALNKKYAGKTFSDEYYEIKINKIFYYYGGISVRGDTNWNHYGEHTLSTGELRKVDNPELKHIVDRIEFINNKSKKRAEQNKYDYERRTDKSDSKRQHDLQYKKALQGKLNESVIEENVADAKQKLYHKDIVEQLRQKGWEPVNSDSDKKYNRDSGNFENYNYVQLRPIGKKFIKGSAEERVEVNLRTGKCKLMAMMRNKPEYEEPNAYKYDLPADVKALCGKLRHSMQANFRSAGKTNYGATLNRTEEAIKNAGKKVETSATFKKTIEDLKKRKAELSKEWKAAKDNGASEDELKKFRVEHQKINERILDLEGLWGNNNIYQRMMKNGLAHDAKVDKRIALANVGKKLEESVVTEGSHHAKYSPALNYKAVNNYLIKARKALRAGNYDEADKWAWEAQESMHEDEMQSAADKNAYNIFKKQVWNIYDAVRKAKGYK